MATAAQFVALAEQQIGIPYVYGGDTPSGFDCSGLVMWCLHQIGISGCPRTSEEQWGWCEHLGGEGDLLPGDLIFEQWPGDSSPPGHVIIWVGGDEVVEAPQTGEDVHERAWSPTETTIVGYGRVPGLLMSAAPSPSPPASEDLDISTMSANGVVSLSFKPGSVSHVQVTTDLGGPGPLELRVVLALSSGPWVQYGGGSSPGTPDFAVSNGYGNFAIASAHVAACGGITLEATQNTRVFSAAAY